MARVWTLTEDAARTLAADHRKLASQVENLRRQAAALHPLMHQPVGVHYHNDSGETIPAYAVMRITDVNSTYTIPWRVLNVSKPNTTFYNVYLVNGPLPCQDGGNGLGSYLTDESQYVLCDSTYTPTAGQEWGPTDGSWSLVRHRPGFLIDGGPTGTGATYRAVAKQRIVTTLRGDLVSDLVYGGTSTMNIWFRNAATGAREDSGLDPITVYDFFLGSGEQWDATTRVLVNFESGIWTVDQAKCAPDSGSGGGGGGGGAASQSGTHLGTDSEGTLFPGGTDYGSAFDPYGQSQDIGSLLGV